MESTRRGILISGLSALLPIRLWPAAVPADGERRRPFNDGWRFFKGEAGGAEQAAFDDSKWRDVRLPHDWAIEGPFDPKLNPHTGALPISGTGWYRKAFTLPSSAQGRYFSIEFDGAMSNSKVWLNGQELGGRPYGYSGFALDLTPHLTFGGASECSGGAADARRSLLALVSRRRHLSQRVARRRPGPVHVAHWGTYVTTPEVTDAQATVAVKVEIRNRGGQPAKVTLRTTVLDPSGKTVASNGTDGRNPGQRHPDRCGQPHGQPAAALGRRSPVPVHAGHRSAGREARGGPLHDALRHPHHRVRQGAGLPAERPPPEAAGRLPAPRSRRARRRRQPPRHRAPAARS